MARTLHLNDTLEQRIGRLAEERHQTSDSIVAEAIEQYLERAEARREFIDEARASLAEYEATGQHLTSDEIDEWLSNWRHGDRRAEPPACHD